MPPKGHKDDDHEPVVVLSEIDELKALVKQQGEQIKSLMAQPVAAVVVRQKPKHNLPDGPRWSIKVRALRTGFYPAPNPDGSRGRTHIRRFGQNESHPGDEFFLEKPEDFAPLPHGWMELATVAPSVIPEAPPTTAAKPVQDPLMGAMPGNPQRIIES